jgi:hypothetical protein
MILQDLLPFVGCCELDPGFRRVMSEAGVALDDLSKAALRDQGMTGIELHDQGLALTLNERNDYIRAYAQPRDQGQAILVAVFAYGPGSRSFSPYAGAIPFSQQAIADRTAALHAFGPPVESEDDDGVIDWDQWFKMGLQVRATYRGDGSLRHIMYSVPLETASDLG